MRNMTTYPAAKDGKFIGYATADQIAENPRLELYDEAAAARLRKESAIKAAVDAKAKDAKVVKAVDAKGGADPAAVKKGQATSR